MLLAPQSKDIYNTQQYKKSGVDFCRKSIFMLLKLSLYKIKFDCYNLIMRNVAFTVTKYQ